jgi:hypothetical protein
LRMRFRELVSTDFSACGFRRCRDAAKIDKGALIV